MFWCFFMDRTFGFQWIDFSISASKHEKPTITLVREKPPSTPARRRPCRCLCLHPVLPSTCHPPTAPSLPSKAGTEPGWRRIAGTTCFIQKMKIRFLSKHGDWRYLGIKNHRIHIFIFYRLSPIPKQMFFGCQDEEASIFLCWTWLKISVIEGPPKLDRDPHLGACGDSSSM